MKNTIRVLIADDHTIVRIDYKNSGIGSASCGPQLMEKYQFNDKKVNFEFFYFPRILTFNMIYS